MKRTLNSNVKSKCEMIAWYMDYIQEKRQLITDTPDMSVDDAHEIVKVIAQLQREVTKLDSQLNRWIYFGDEAME